MAISIFPPRMFQPSVTRSSTHLLESPVFSVFLSMAGLDVRSLEQMKHVRSREVGMVLGLVTIRLEPLQQAKRRAAQEQFCRKLTALGAQATTGKRLVVVFCWRVAVELSENAQEIGQFFGEMECSGIPKRYMTDLNNMLPELCPQPTEFAMFFENWTFPH